MVLEPSQASPPASWGEDSQCSPEPGATQLLPLNATLSPLGQPGLCLSCSAPPKAVHVSFIMFWCLGKPRLADWKATLSLSSQGQEYSQGAAQAGEATELLKLCKDMNICQQQDEVLSTEMSLQGDKGTDPLLAGAGLGPQGCSGHCGGSFEGTGGWGTHPKEMPTASSPMWSSEMGTPAPLTVHTMSWVCLWKGCKFQSTSFAIFPSPVSASLQLQEVGNAQRSQSPLYRAQPWPSSGACHHLGSAGNKQTPGEAPAAPFPGILAPPAPPNTGMVSA